MNRLNVNSKKKVIKDNSRVYVTSAQKLEIIEKLKNNPKLTNKKVGLDYGVSKSFVQKLVSSYKNDPDFVKTLTEAHPQAKKIVNQEKYPELDEAVLVSSSSQNMRELQHFLSLSL